MTRAYVPHPTKPRRRRAPQRVYSSDGGSLVEIHDAACVYVVTLFSAEGESACKHALARPEIRGDGDVWLHWSCTCCGDGAAHCYAVASED